MFVSAKIEQKIAETTLVLTTKVIWPKSTLRCVSLLRALMPSASSDYNAAWEIFVRELLDALQNESKLWVNAFLAERLFPHIAG